ncbi:transcriptional regulator [Roseomonas sp. OT10]|uniref:transcriptional regulator n=1 Tax=Roseomonas cutis TaxID=2897332 RepID=UPI001E589F7F|nr:transcriptional regulator [Roseomonas sp. OT10]UFN50423.1 transcriptional regulator [Roseomonas sp. OT10]
MARVFLDFEASSLGKRSVPIEVGWVFEDGEGEDHLIHPAPDWTDWSALAEATHRIPRERLLREGEAHGAVARRMVERLAGQSLYATAPSWDGQWLSRLLRAAGLPRHALRLRDTDEAEEAAVQAALRDAGIPEAEREVMAGSLLAATREAWERAERPPAHRALEDARQSLARFQAIRRAAESAAAAWRRGEAPAGG